MAPPADESGALGDGCPVLGQCALYLAVDGMGRGTTHAGLRRTALEDAISVSRLDAERLSTEYDRKTPQAPVPQPPAA